MSDKTKDTLKDKPRKSPLFFVDRWKKRNPNQNKFPNHIKLTDQQKLEDHLNMSGGVRDAATDEARNEAYTIFSDLSEV